MCTDRRDLVCGHFVRRESWEITHKNSQVVSHTRALDENLSECLYPVCSTWCAHLMRNVTGWDSEKTPERHRQIYDKNVNRVEIMIMICRLDASCTRCHTDTAHYSVVITTAIRWDSIQSTRWHSLGGIWTVFDGIFCYPPLLYLIKAMKFDGHTIWMLNEDHQRRV